MDNRFAEIGGRLYTKWYMIDGHVMTGELIARAVTQDAYTVIRPDGTTCHVPACECTPATPEDILKAISFFQKK